MGAKLGSGPKKGRTRPPEPGASSRLPGQVGKPAIPRATGATFDVRGRRLVPTARRSRSADHSPRSQGGPRGSQCPLETRVVSRPPCPVCYRNSCRGHDGSPRTARCEIQGAAVHFQATIRLLSASCDLFTRWVGQSRFARPVLAAGLPRFRASEQRRMPLLCAACTSQRNRRTSSA